MLPCECLQKDCPNWQNQVGETSCSVDRSQPYSFTAIDFVCWAKAQNQRCHPGRNGAYAWIQWHGLPLAKANQVMTPTQSSTFQEQRSILNLWHGIVPRGKWPAFRHFYCFYWKWQCFGLIRIDTYSRQGLVFLAHNVSEKTNLCIVIDFATNIIIFYQVLLLIS